MAKKRKAAPKGEAPAAKNKPKPAARLKLVSSESDSEDKYEEEVEESEKESSSEEEEEEEEKEEEESDSEEEDEESESESEEEEEEKVSKREFIKKLLKPFGKEQLVDLLRDAAAKNPSMVSDITKSADSDPVHRKIFVHGLAWDTTNETLAAVFSPYGPMEECHVVSDKSTGRSKGYGFVLFKSRRAARKALQEPQKKIGNRMAACQLAAAGPPQSQPGSGSGLGSEPSSRKLYVANVGPQISVEKLRAYLASYGEIEEGPLGLDKTTGKFRGFAVIVYKTVQGIKKALEEPVKMLEGCKLQCSVAIEGRTTNKTNNNVTPTTTGPVAVVVGGSGSGTTFAPNNNVTVPNNNMQQLGMNLQGLVGQNLNPQGLMPGQNPALGVWNPPMLLGFGFGAGTGAMVNQTTGLSSSSFAGGGMQQSLNAAAAAAAAAGFGGQAQAQSGVNFVSPSVIGSYGPQAALQGLSAYQSSQLGQCSAPAPTAAATLRSHNGIGSTGSYFGR